MNKENVLGFIRDSKGITIGFLVNGLCLIGFYQIITNGAVEVIYPVIMSITIYSIYMIFRAINYFDFIKLLEDSKNSLGYNLKINSYKDNLVFEKIEYQYKEHMKAIAEYNSKMKEFRCFFSQWVHNMKTPIAVIELILQGEEVKQKAAVSSEIRDETIRLADNLEKALSFIRLEDFSKDYSPEKVDLYKSVKDIINRKKREFIYNKVYPRIECEYSEVYVLTDLKWNEFLIEQLTNNAIKYSALAGDSKNISYIIHCNEDKTYLTVKDEGIGIPKQDLNRIYEAFFTGENGRKVKTSSGIGLYLASEVADRIGHEIKVESEVGVGSEFTISYLSKM